eukprot:1161095-Pelagomonas_calceolata.AAC.4
MPNQKIVEWQCVGEERRGWCLNGGRSSAGLLAACSMDQGEILERKIYQGAGSVRTQSWGSGFVTLYPGGARVFLPCWMDERARGDCEMGGSGLEFDGRA